MRRILSVFVREVALEGSEIASFRISQRGWQVAAKNVGFFCILSGLAQQVYFAAHQAYLKVPVSTPPSAGPFLLIGCAANLISGNCRIRFYEKGLRIPKAAGYVFLSREQIVDMKLDGSSFMVTGPDANWGGPYSGGTFRVRDIDLSKFRDTLEKFTHACE